MRSNAMKFIVDVTQVQDKILQLKGRENHFFGIFARMSGNDIIGVFSKKKCSGPLRVKSLSKIRRILFNLKIDSLMTL